MYAPQNLGGNFRKQGKPWDFDDHDGVLPRIPGLDYPKITPNNSAGSMQTVDTMKDQFKVCNATMDSTTRCPCRKQHGTTLLVASLLSELRRQPLYPAE